jgi:hypothetical protein
MSITTSLACPKCSTTLKAKQGVAAGARVRCPRCGTAFVAGSSVAPPPMPRPGEPTTSSNRGVVLAIIVGGLLLLAGGGVGLALMFSGGGASSNRDDKQANRDKDGKERVQPAPNVASNDSTPRTDAAVPRDNAARPGDGIVLPRDLASPPRDQAAPRDQATAKDKPAPAPDKDRATEPKEPPKPVVEEPLDRNPLPKEEQDRVNKAVEKGVAFLKRTQDPSDGTWAKGTYTVGYTAWPTLTLLECGVPGDDPTVQAAVKYVRENVVQSELTYEVATAILLLDRLGEDKDEELIRSLALRLIAGQTKGGGWSYKLPVLRTLESRDLMLALQQTRPLSSRELLLEASGSKGGGDDGVGSKNTDRPKPAPKDDKGPTKGVSADDFRKATKNLPDSIKKTLALQPPPAKDADFPKEDVSPLSNMPSDNSNTQFGLLAVWVAGRHGVPTERSLAMVARRFRTSQTKEGSWDYFLGAATPEPATPAMCAAGLLGLAVGHGLDGAAQGANAPPKKVDDPNIKRALEYLSKHVGKPLGPKAQRPQNREVINLYFLWSVERVGVLYAAKTIGDKDWYQWGAELLVDSQNENGSWHPWKNDWHPPELRNEKADADIVYHGSYRLIDTSFALLFLKKANLVKDLTKKLEFVIDSTK